MTGADASATASNATSTVDRRIRIIEPSARPATATWTRLDTIAIAAMLGKSTSELGDGIRPDLRTRVEHLLAEAAGERAKRRGTR